MRKIRLILIILIFIGALFCCSDNNSKFEEVNGNTLKLLVDSALKGSITANQRLSGLIDADNIIKENYNQLKIDSITIDGKKFFSILAEYPNPKLNILAIYDNYLNFYLLDRSLNGNLSGEWKTFDSKIFLVVSEKFKSKDLLKIDRKSLYALQTGKWKLTFRFYTRFEIDKRVYTQEIKTFSPDKIETSIKPMDKNLTSNGDTFLFNESSGKYLSNENIFGKYIVNQVKEFNWIPTNPQLGITTVEIPKPGFNKGDYILSVNSDWKEIDDMTLTSKFHKDLYGDRFVNPKLGAAISVASIDYVSSAEDYCKYNFSVRRSVNYVIRDSGLIEQGIYVARIIEHSCNSKKYLLIFECSKNAYEQNKTQIDKLIDSFSVRC